MPQLVPLAYKVVNIAAGLNSAYVLTSQGEVLYWGADATRRFGRHKRDSCLNPHMIYMPPGVKAQKVWAGGYHAFFQARNGDVYGWGLNAKGQLGLGDDDLANHERPVKINRAFHRLPIQS